MTIFNAKEVEALVLLRDGCTMVLDGVNKLLEETEPKEPQKALYDISKIKTTRTEGPNGFYEKATTQNSEDYKLLLEDLGAHDGKITKGGFFCWLFNDKTTVGLKPSKR